MPERAVPEEGEAPEQAVPAEGVVPERAVPEEGEAPERAHSRRHPPQATSATAASSIAIHFVLKFSLPLNPSASRAVLGPARPAAGREAPEQC